MVVLLLQVVSGVVLLCLDVVFWNVVFGVVILLLHFQHEVDEM